MKVLIHGFGSIGRQHLNACLKSRPQYSYAVLRREKNEEISGAQSFDNIQEALSFKPNLTFVCTPTFLHLASVEALAPTGTAFFLEKPIAESVSSIGEIQTILERRALSYFYGCVLRHHPVIKHVKALLSEKTLGSVLSYTIHCGSYLPSWRPQQDYRQSYSASMEKGGGVSLDLIHEFDYASFWFGPIKQLNGYKTKVSALEITSDDLCATHVFHDSGVKGFITLNYFQRNPRRDFEINCEQGTIRGDVLTGALSVLGPSGHDSQNFKIDRDQLFLNQVTELFSKLEKGQSNLSSLKQDCDLLEKVLQIPVLQ